MRNKKDSEKWKKCIQHIYWRIKSNYKLLQFSIKYKLKNRFDSSLEYWLKLKKNCSWFGIKMNRMSLSHGTFIHYNRLSRAIIKSPFHLKWNLMHIMIVKIGELSLWKLMRVNVQCMRKIAMKMVEFFEYFLLHFKSLKMIFKCKSFISSLNIPISVVFPLNFD